MIACIARAFYEGVSIFDFNYLSTISSEDFAHILRGNVKIPLFEERLNALRNISTKLAQNYGASLRTFIVKHGNKVTQLREALVENFPSLNDIAEYEGKTIYFHKRAQLLLADIHEMIEDNFIQLIGTDKLTACADYKLPQALRKFGIFEYSKDLTEKIDNKIELSDGSKEETEIRSATVQVVEMIRKKLQNKGIDATAMDVNDHLWLLTQTKYPDDKPYHLVRTISY